MLTYLLLAGGYALAAAAQPGPFLAYLISQSLAHGWRRTLPAALAPLLSDGPVILVVLFVLTRLPPVLLIYLRLAGGLFLLYLAYGAFSAWRNLRTEDLSTGSPSEQTVLKAALVNLLNPGPWISWSLIMGPLLLKAWREAPANGIAFLAGFYGVMIAGLAAIILAFSAARRLGRRLIRAMVGASALALLAFGGYQVGMAGVALRAAWQG